LSEQNLRFDCAPVYRSEAALLDSMEVVLEANDVIFSQVGAGLDLDNLKRDLSGIFETMLGTNRNVNRLVFIKEPISVVNDDERCSSNNDPVLRSMMVRLKGQTFTGLNNNMLDLMASSHRQRLKGSPGTSANRVGFFFQKRQRMDSILRRCAIDAFHLHLHLHLHFYLLFQSQARKMLFFAGGRPRTTPGLAMVAAIRSESWLSFAVPWRKRSLSAPHASRAAFIDGGAIAASRHSGIAGRVTDRAGLVAIDFKFLENDLEDVRRLLRLLNIVRISRQVRELSDVRDVEDLSFLAIQIDLARPERFGHTMRENFSSGSIPFRTACLQCLIDVIATDDTQIPIKVAKMCSKERPRRAGVRFRRNRQTTHILVVASFLSKTCFMRLSPKCCSWTPASSGRFMRREPLSSVEAKRGSHSPSSQAKRGPFRNRRGDQGSR
jgi:hypothetical protein